MDIPQPLGCLFQCQAILSAKTFPLYSVRNPLSCNLWPLPLPPFAVHLSSVIAVLHNTSYNANENIHNFLLEYANLHISKQNQYLQTSLISTHTTCAFSKHSSFCIQACSCELWQIWMSNTIPFKHWKKISTC